MQNNTITSSLLQAHIENNANKANTSSYQSFSAPKPNLIDKNQPTEDTFTKKEPDEKKQKIAEISLLSAIALGGIMAVGTIIKHKGFSLDKIKNGIPDVSKGLDNITNVKDTLVRKIFKRFPLYNRFDDFASNLYRKSGQTTIVNNYQKASDAFIQAEEITKEAARKANMDASAIERLSELLRRKKENIGTFASKECVVERFSELDNKMRGMEEDGWQKLTGFIKDRKFKEGAKSLMTESIVADRIVAAKEFQETMTGAFKNGGLSEIEAGELEELLKTIERAAGDKSLKAIRKADELYKKAYTKETVDLVQKLRDINCGSAPTDIEGIIGTLGLLGLYTAQADTKEERVGVTLTTGVPLAVTLGTTLVAACKLISGAKAFGLGLLTGAIAKTVGGAINTKYQKSKGTNKETGTIVTLDDYMRKIKES